MRERRSIIFWMGSVVTQSLLEVSTSVMEEMSQRGINLLAIPNFQQFTERFVLGKIDDLQFFKELTAGGKIDLDAAEILSAVKETMKPEPRTLAAISLLPPKYQRWLVCEFPVAWYQQVDNKFGMTDYFPTDHVLFLSAAGLDQITPHLFDYLPDRVGDTLENCLYFDQNSRRVIAAINRSFPAVIYVDPSRLEREFVMRNFIDRHQPVHTPPVTI
jgi:FMN phosphatase YigB (HAD superfamily)